jgi:hypothetical protein
MKLIKRLLIAATIMSVPSPMLALCSDPPVTGNDLIITMIEDASGQTFIGPANGLTATQRQTQGALYFDRSSKGLRVCDGTDWVSVMGGAGGAGAPQEDYVWASSGWGACQKSGSACHRYVSGTQYRTVYCEETATGDQVAGSNCSGAPPATSQGCQAWDETGCGR